GVGVGRRARPGLEDVQNEMLIEITGHDLVGGCPHGLGDLLVDVPTLGGGRRRRPLEQAQRPDEATGEADPGNGEVVFGSLGGGPVESVGGYLHLAHRILLDTVRHSGLLSAWTVATLKGCPVKRCRQPATVTILS